MVNADPAGSLQARRVPSVRRQLLVVAGSLLAVAASSCVTDDRTLPPPPTASPAEATSADLPACGPQELRANLIDGEGATGYNWDYVALVTVGELPCTVPTEARLELRDADGQVVSVSKGRRPFIPMDASAARAVLRPGPAPDDWDPSLDVLRAAVAQGICPGGVFPEGGSLHLLLRGVGAVEIEGFDADLPWEYRCDERETPPRGDPELLISDLVGPSR